MENGKKLMHSFGDNGDESGNYEGLTKREHFASIAMQGILSNKEIINRTGNPIMRKQIIEESIKCADELLKQLEQDNQS
jgi:hypothetical protein